MKIVLSILLPIVILFAILTEASALSFQGTAAGTWTNIDSQPTDIVGVWNRDHLSSAVFTWGLPIDTFNNQFIFSGIGDFYGSKWTAEIGNPFLLGNFSYRNERTFLSSTVNGVDLSIAVNLSTPSGPERATYFGDFSFSITNTPNSSGDPQLDADTVTIARNFSTAQFSYLGVDYTFDVLGFSSDDGISIISDLITPEGGFVSAGLYGQISRVAPVPEPATVLLVGIGLVGLGGVVKFKSKKKRP